jgi:hypothetical protein
MGRNAIQIQKGLFIPELQKHCGTEIKCQEALVQKRLPQGIPRLRCEGNLGPPKSLRKNSLTNRVFLSGKLIALCSGFSAFQRLRTPDFRRFFPLELPDRCRLAKSQGEHLIMQPPSPVRAGCPDESGCRQSRAAETPRRPFRCRGL